MGCIHSKKRPVSVAASSPVLDFSTSRPPHSLAVLDRSSVASSKNSSGFLSEFEKKLKKDRKEGLFNNKHHHQRKNSCSSNRTNHNDDGDQAEDLDGSSQKRKMKREADKSGALSFNLGLNSHNNRQNVGAEQVAAGWPCWLAAAAAEAIYGLVPLRADAFERLEKIGQGTYSSVFRAREVETGKIVALKKVRFDNYQPESIRFMAREIVILRRLDHPNIMRLEGIITSRLSNSIYLVFEYMEHDLAGLSSSPDIQFSESQVKCYMKQLLLGLEHCHLRGVMHRDIKSSNILVNNEGLLKVADFGLANVLRIRQQLTSRVVTLWYRSPELLLGSTSYGLSVDLWSVGCIFAELLIGKPLLKGGTEVEQLHKIFKLCGSPTDDYWNHSKLPNATLFRPQHQYESSLREKFKDFPATAVDLLKTFLSIEPEKRGTASSALMSQYFNTVPYACDPSSLPKYAPNKEMDAKCREDARRKKSGGRMRDPGAQRKPRRVHRTMQQQHIFYKLAQKEDAKENAQIACKTNDGRKRRGDLRREQSSFDTISETSQVTKGDSVFSGPAPVALSSGFAWAKKRKEDAMSTISYDQSISSSQISALDSSRFNFANGCFNLKTEDNNRDCQEASSKDSLDKHQDQIDTRDSFDSSNLFYSYDAKALEEMQKRQSHLNLSGSFDASNLFHSYDIKAAEEEEGPQRSNLGLNQRQKLEYSASGPLPFQLSKIDQASKIDAILQRNESQIRQAARRSRLDREM